MKIFSRFFNVFRPALVLFISFTLILGVLYPFVTAGLGHWLFPAQVAGSLIKKDDQIVGSRWIGQNFSDPKYFWGRPSATTPYPNNGMNSGGSNLGPLNPDLLSNVKARIAALREADPDNQMTIPVDLVTASASGLDPDISPAAAFYQVNRVARLRHLPAARVKLLVTQTIEGRQFYILGEPRVNVLKLNLALERL